MNFILEELKPYRLAQQLRGIAARHPDEARALTDAADWLEQEAADLEKLAGSVTHKAIKGCITPGCVL